MEGRNWVVTEVKHKGAQPIPVLPTDVTSKYDKEVMEHNALGIVPTSYHI